MRFHKVKIFSAFFLPFPSPWYNIHRMSMNASSLETWYLQLTDRCTNACPHCFSSCSPAGRAVVPFALVRKWIHHMSVVAAKRIVFTGGEPFLYFPMLRNLVHEAATRNLWPAVWTNGYWITGTEEFRLTLRYMADVGLKQLILSDDPYHGATPFSAFADQLAPLAAELGVDLRWARIEPKNPSAPPDYLFADHHVLAGPLMFRGRAAKECTAHQMRWSLADFDACPFLSFESPKSLFIDVRGFLNICPGFPLADLKVVSLKKFFTDFELEKHSVAHAIATGGPARLAGQLSVTDEDGFADFCHACWVLRHGPPGETQGR
ncbi:4Fe-4S cluster-binding domain-containing protein [Myxococcota bacterium]|nr:4Fe-4S cluster-binding domain-containing protein [Myxococcota bacterium]MBU1410605.1 4Fe-4S cluster-binding domain-containing protein [Myxococcota bacterium]MBU1511304.1 4Fe-4S cluster-binding domain-containing protein [Myxococcota bacterium]